MREVIGGKSPISVHGAQVLDLQLNERRSQLSIVPQIVGKGVGLELEAAAEDVHEELDDIVGGAEDVAEEEEADDDGVLGVEAKIGVEGVVVYEDREEGKDVEEVSLVGGLIQWCEE